MSSVQFTTSQDGHRIAFLETGRSESHRTGIFWLGGFMRYDSVAGAAFASSPLVTARQHWSYGFAVSWVFAVSGQRVKVED